jgi:cell division cycle protein 20 (cofactor of APC complex)
MRSLSSASIRSSSPAVSSYSDLSAKYHLRNTKVSLDYSAPSSDAPSASFPLLSCSPHNVLFFSRGNRVHYKNLTTSEDVGQLCKLQESHGDLRIVECAGADLPDLVALGTSKGYVHIWDTKSKKMTASWSTKGVSVMRWNGPVLTIGGLKGTIKHYDTRVNPTPKMKEQARKVTRHQTPITSLAWNVTGKLLASGDQTGTVYCWETGQRTPLDVGDFIQRRKKIQHEGAISVCR